MSKREIRIGEREEHLNGFSKYPVSSVIQKKSSYLLNYLVNSDICHFKISLQIFPRVVLLYLYTGRVKAVDSTQSRKYHERDTINRLFHKTEQEDTMGYSTGSIDTAATVDIAKPPENASKSYRWKGVVKINVERVPSM